MSQPKPGSTTVGEQGVLGSVATVEEVLKSRLFLMLLIRYILWQLVGACYSWLLTPIEWITNRGFTLFALVASKHFDLSGVNRYFEQHEFLAVPVVFVAQSFRQIIFDGGSFIIFLAFGWPLFKDINTANGIKWADYRPKKLIRTAFQRRYS